MPGDGWVLAAARTWLRTGVARTSVAAASVALGVGAFILAGLLGAAQLAQVTVQIEANEGRPATILVTAADPMTDLQARSAAAVISSPDMPADSILSLTDAGTLSLCMPDRAAADQPPAATPRVLAATGGTGMFPALAELDASPAGGAAVVLGVGVAPETYVRCEAPQRTVTVQPLGTGARLPGYEGAVFTTIDQVRSHPLVFDSPLNSRAWLIHVPPGQAERELSEIAPALRNWALTTGNGYQFDVQRIDTADSYARTVSDTARVLRIIALVLLSVGALGLANVQTVLIAQRTRQLALLRAFGATPRSLTALVVTETLAICLLGAVAGTCLAVTLYAAISPGAPLTGNLLVRQLALAAAASLAVGLISGMIPALRARRLDVKEALYR